MSRAWGSLKTFFNLLTIAPSMTTNGVTVQFGEELISANDAATPRVTVVAVGGRYGDDGEPGYEVDGDPDIETQWGVAETIECWCWGFDNITVNPQPIDHADATENIRAYVLQALQWQQVSVDAGGKRIGGYRFVPVSERWERFGDAVNRQGRALVITVAVDITVRTVRPPKALVTAVVFNPALESA